jgi:hypothetical protein
MEKQKKQLMALLAVLVVAVVAFFGVSKISNADEEEDTTPAYSVNEIEADNVTRLVFTNSNGTVSLSKSGDEWYSEDDKSLDIDEDTVNTLVGKMAGLTSDDKIENVTDLSQYGLDEPVKTIMISDGTNTCTILVGSYNSITSTYYICLESDTTTVYSTDNRVNTFSKTIDDLIAEPETETETETEIETETETETETEVSTAQ